MRIVTDEPVLNHLRRLQAGQADIHRRLDRIEADIRGVRTHMAAMLDTEARRDGDIAALEIRVGRIERRLDLTD